MKLKTKGKFLLLFMLVFSLILCLGSVSASEDTADIAVLEDSDVINLEDSQTIQTAAQEDEITAAEEVQELETANCETQLSTELSDDDSTLSTSPAYDDYTAFTFTTNFTYGFSNKLIVYVDSELQGSNTYAYDFYVRIYDSSGNQVFSVNEYDTEDFTGTITYTFAAKRFSVGTYTVKIINYADNEVKSTATIYVNKASGVLSAGNYAALYNSGKTFNVRLTQSGTSNAISNVSVKLVFKKGSKTYTRTAYTDSSGYVKINPNVPVGTYTVQISVADSGVLASSITKTAKVKRTGIKLKISKINTYQGIKFKLKAKVKSSSGKKVTEGYVLFKINGKKYKVAVKKGVASKKIKISKVTKGKYTAKYVANKNYKSKKATKKYNIKKRYATKTTVKNYSGYGGTTKTITAIVKTKEGKKVKNGYVAFVSSGGYYAIAKVKNGKAKIRYSFYNYYYYYFYTYYYSKTTKFKIKAKYFPSTYKYKCSSTKFKVTHKYKCVYCGKKKTHSHGYYQMKVS